METVAKVDFHGMEPLEFVRSRILVQIAQLEARVGRITSCRVAINGPGEHHRNGGLFHVTIQLALPQGREVVVDRLPQQDERYASLKFAINDTFRRARRQLQDSVLQMQGAVKQHDQPATAKIARLDEGYGFLETADGQEIYFHANSVLDAGFGKLKAGSRVAFHEERGERGAQASTVRRLGRHGLRH